MVKRVVKCLHNQLSAWSNVCMENCLHGQMSAWPNVRAERPARRLDRREEPRTWRARHCMSTFIFKANGSLFIPIYLIRIILRFCDLVALGVLFLDCKISMIGWESGKYYDFRWLYPKIILWMYDCLFKLLCDYRWRIRFQYNIRLSWKINH